jgi:hypothetical protein
MSMQQFGVDTTNELLITWVNIMYAHDKLFKQLKTTACNMQIHDSKTIIE